MAIRVERRTDLDPEEIRPLVEESLRDGWRFLVRLRDEWSSGENRFDRRGEILLTARDGPRLVGIAGVNCDPYATDARTGRLRHLYVLRSIRRRGIGRMLVDRAVLHARDHFARLRLRTDSSAAAAFYESLGFRPAPEENHATHVLTLTTRTRKTGHDGR